MRKFNVFNVCMLALLVLISACSKDNAPFVEPLDNRVTSVVSERDYGIKDNTRPSDGFRDAKSIMQKVQPEVAEYFNNVKSVMYATNSLDKISSFRATNQEKEVSETNPMIEKLKALDIYDEETGKKLDFFELGKEEKDVFVDNLLASEANDMSDKLANIPGLDKLIAEENKITSKAIEEEGINKIKVGEEVSEGFRSANKLVSSDKFFAKIQKGYENLYGYESKEVKEEARSVSGALTGIAIVGAIITDIKDLPIIPVERVIRKWSACSRRGDFVVALPSHGKPWKFVNFGSNVRFMVGHAGILTKQITPYTREKYDRGVYKESTLECYTGTGVDNHTPDNWITPHYVMGVQKVKYKWKWRWFRSGFYKVKTPVSNPGALADWAEKYEGRKYVRWYEFLTAKWAAPSRFTCTTLVWYCAKRAYGINVSSWWAIYIYFFWL